MPSTAIRQSVLTGAKRVVIKVGSQLLTRTTEQGPALNRRYLTQLAKQIKLVTDRGVQVTLVCSGAIAAGCMELKLHDRPKDVASMQAIAAVGQRRLMAVMHDVFAKAQLGVGQVLLTREDFDDRVRFLNIRNCIARLHELGCIAVLNENDSVAVDEIRFGDNDLLAALTANAMRADALILLSVIDGLLDDQQAVIDRVDNVIDYVALARQSTSRWGTGGMLSKFEAARLVTEAGEVAIIANGRTKNIVPRLLDGEKLGTVFVPADRKLDSRQRWIGLTARPSGTVTIDDGAVKALVTRGKSLLATGIVELTGQFERGSLLLVRDQRGKEVARGLSNYSDHELGQIAGKRTDQFEAILGKPGYSEVIHRDHMVLAQSEPIDPDKAVRP